MIEGLLLGTDDDRIYPDLNHDKSDHDKPKINDH